MGGRKYGFPLKVRTRDAEGKRSLPTSDLRPQASGLLPQSTVEQKGRKGHEGAEEDGDAPSEGEALPHKNLEKAGAENEKEQAVKGADDAHRERQVGEVLQGHRDAQQDQVGDPVEDRGEAKTIDGRGAKVEAHREGRDDSYFFGAAAGAAG